MTLLGVGRKSQRHQTAIVAARKHRIEHLARAGGRALELLQADNIGRQRVNHRRSRSNCVLRVLIDTVVGFEIAYVIGHYQERTSLGTTAFVLPFAQLFFAQF